MRWTIDLAHSRVEFVIRMNGAAQTGRFERVGGAIELTSDGTPKQIEAVIEARRGTGAGTIGTPDDLAVDSITTGNGPQMTFLHASIEMLESNRFIARGTLEFQGEVHPITLDLTVSNHVHDGSSGNRVCVTAESSMQLEDWVQTWMGISDLAGHGTGRAQLTFRLEIVTPEALREDYDLILSMLAHA